MASEGTRRLSDLPPKVIEQRLKTVNELFRLGMSFKKGKIQGPASPRLREQPGPRDPKPETGLPSSKDS